jgi:hypothetical protein
MQAEPPENKWWLTDAIGPSTTRFEWYLFRSRLWLDHSVARAPTASGVANEDPAFDKSFYVSQCSVVRASCERRVLRRGQVPLEVIE